MLGRLLGPLLLHEGEHPVDEDHHEVATPSWGMPATKASAPATQSMRAKKWVSWPTSFRQVRTGGGGGKTFGPSASRRAAACADVRPG